MTTNETIFEATSSARILEWLRKTGYPLELRVGRHFQAAGWNVVYSQWFRDLRTRKSRAIDVQAVTGAVNPKDASLVFTLCIECKTSQHPWVAFGSGDNLGSHGMRKFSSGRLTRMCLISAAAEKVKIPDIVPPSTPRAGGLTQAILGKQGRSSPSAYRALLQARSAALALDREYEEAVLDGDGLPTVAICVPLVVLKGQLFEYTVSPGLSENLREVDAIVASVPGDQGSETALVPVVTETYAQGFGEDLYRSVHGFCVALGNSASLIAGAVRIRASEALDATDRRNAN